MPRMRARVGQQDVRQMKDIKDACRCLYRVCDECGFELREKTRVHLLKMADEIERLGKALMEIDQMPCTMVNDSESLRHTIKTMKNISHSTLVGGENRYYNK
jgi:hypothetical protein